MEKEVLLGHNLGWLLVTSLETEFYVWVEISKILIHLQKKMTENVTLVSARPSEEPAHSAQSVFMHSGPDKQ